jgi:methyl-accepting chemotaxis protein
MESNKGTEENEPEACKGGEEKHGGRRKLSLGGQMRATLLPVVSLILCVILVSISYIMIVESTKLVDQLVKTRGTAASDSILIDVNEIEEAENTVAGMYQTGLIADGPSASKYIHSDAAKLQSCTEGLYFVTTDGTCYSLSDKDMNGESNPEYLDEDWYKFGIQQKTAAMDKCTYDDSSKEYSVTISRQVCDQSGKTVGVIAGDLVLKDISDTLKQIVENTSYNLTLMDSGSSMIVASTDKNQVGYKKGSGKNTFAEALLNDLGNGRFSTRYKYGASKEIVSVMQVSGTPWYVATYITSAKAMSGVRIMLSVAILDAVLGIIILYLVITFVLKRKMRGLVSAKEAVVRLCDGDFSSRIDDSGLKYSDEIFEMTSHLNYFIELMQDMLAQLQSIADEMNGQASDFSGMAQGLDESAGTQSHDLGELNNTITQMAEATQQLAENATNLSAIAQNTSESSQKAGTDMHDTIGKARNVKSSVEDVSGTIEQTHETMEQLAKLNEQVETATEKINSITDVIKGIAQQTNLLSLNASIEAARAGESGRGFAVVAEEIKGLAETSAENADEIAKQISSITQLIQETSVSTKESLGSIKRSTESMHAMRETFGDMIGSIESTGKVLDEVVEQNGKVNDIAANIAAISEEQAASSEEISATTENVAHLVEGTKKESSVLYEGTKTMSHNASEMESKMKQFTLEKKQ